MDAARGFFYYDNTNLVIDSDGMSLDNDRIAVQIAKSLMGDEVLPEWMFSMRAWHI